MSELPFFGSARRRCFCGSSGGDDRASESQMRGVYFAIGTLGWPLSRESLFGNVFPGVSFLPAKYLASFTLTPRYYVALILMLVTIGAVYLLVNSRLGLGMIAVKEDEEAAAATGINTFKCKVLALMVSTFLAGLAGGVYAFYSAVYYYFVPFELIWSFEPVLIVIIGGAGTIIGPIWGQSVMSPSRNCLRSRLVSLVFPYLLFFSLLPFYLCPAG